MIKRNAGNNGQYELQHTKKGKNIFVWCWTMKAAIIGCDTGSIAFMKQYDISHVSKHTIQYVRIILGEEW